MNKDISTITVYPQLKNVHPVVCKTTIRIWKQYEPANCSRKYRNLDVKIQELNWKTELMER
ncbi:hypothetical protein LCM00_11320 [Bacillus infantis]|uniref:DIP1984 family protein n=1 Tax=Bacillus infantis TaxID=324767 RepID=UPI001CD2B559|nr:hypothetical protein [Bacillus infantis]MCA1040089.1 hypothetical protein [Bacillus infantis]